MGSCLDLFRYTTLSVAGGLLYSLEPHEECNRETLRAHLRRSFHGTEYLRRVMEVAFERSLKALCVGLKRPWLISETVGRDYCERFGENIFSPFSAENELLGRPLIDFIDAFFLDYQYTVKNAPQILGLSEVTDDAVEDALAAIVDMKDAADVDVVEEQAANFLSTSLRETSGLEAEHPINRFASHKRLLLRGIQYYVHDVVRTDPRVAGTLASIEPRTLKARETHLAGEASSSDSTPFLRAEAVKELGKAQLLRAVHERIQGYREDIGGVASNGEWLFDIADRLEENIDEAPSAIQGRVVPTPTLVAICSGSLEPALTEVNVDGVIGARDQLVSADPKLKKVIQGVRSDFRLAHWGSERYGDVANLIGAALYAVVGPRAADRYFRESRGVGGDLAVASWNLFKAQAENANFNSALELYQTATTEAPDRFRLFDHERFVPQRILGAGMTGMTFECLEGDDRVVVKACWAGDPGDDDEQGPDPSLVTHALRDVAPLAANQSPLLTRLREHGNYRDRRPYVVSDYVEGIDLAALLRERGPLSALDAAALGVRLAEAIHATHACGALHRNVHPSNVILLGIPTSGPLTTDGALPELRLCDGGLWNLATCTPGAAHEKLQALSGRSLIGRKISLNTLDYSSPEEVAARWDSMGAGSDIYGLGTTLYRMLAASSPRQAKQERLPKIEPLRSLVMRCLSRDPAERPQSAAEAVQLFREAWESAQAAGDPARHPVTHGREEDAAPEPAGLVVDIPPAPPMQPPAPEGAPSQESAPDEPMPMDPVEALRHMESGAFFIKKRDADGKPMELIDNRKTTAEPPSAEPTPSETLPTESAEPAPLAPAEDEEEPEALDPLEALKLLEGQLSTTPEAPAAERTPAVTAAPDENEDNVEYGLMISGLGFGGKKQKAIAIIVDLLKSSEDEARDMVRSPVIPVLKRVKKSEAEAAHKLFRDALITARITERKVRR